MNYPDTSTTIVQRRCILCPFSTILLSTRGPIFCLLLESTAVFPKLRTQPSTTPSLHHHYTCKHAKIFCVPDDRLHIVVPLVMSVCQVSPQVDDAVEASLSFQFGKICSGLAGEMHHWAQSECSRVHSHMSTGSSNWAQLAGHS